MKLSDGEKIRRLDKDHVIHPNSVIGDECSIIIDSGKGVWLRDIEGNEYIDARAQLTCVNLGYGNKELIDAIKAQADKLQFSSLFYGFTHQPITECAERLADMTPEGLNHVFFTSGGSEAVESAFMIVRLYWHLKGLAKSKIISLYGSYHGNTLIAASATGLHMGGFESIRSLSGFIHIPPYYCYRCSFDKEYPGCNIQCARYLSETIKREGPESVAAFIAEPVLGVGGAIVPPAEYWPLVRQICTEYGVILIADEIQTGFGRTGKTFGVDHWSVRPDMMVMGKGITGSYQPLAAVAVHDDIFERLKGGHLTGFTHGGHPIAAAVASKAMEICKRDEIAEYSLVVGKHILSRLKEEFQPLPNVADVGGLGLMIGIELVKDKKTRVPLDSRIMSSILPRALKNGLMIRARDTRMAFTPPLIISIEEADLALDRLYPIIANLTNI